MVAMIGGLVWFFIKRYIHAGSCDQDLLAAKFGNLSPKLPRVAISIREVGKYYIIHEGEIVGA